MTTKAVSALTAATSCTSGDYIVAVQSSTTKKVSYDLLYSYLSSASNGWATVSSASYAATPAGPNSITVVDTGIMAAGMPIKINGTKCGIISGVVTNSYITYIGPSNSDAITSLLLGTTDRIKIASTGDVWRYSAAQVVGYQGVSIAAWHIWTGFNYQFANSIGQAGYYTVTPTGATYTNTSPTIPSFWKQLIYEGSTLTSGAAATIASGGTTVASYTVSSGTLATTISALSAVVQVAYGGTIAALTCTVGAATSDPISTNAMRENWTDIGGAPEVIPYTESTSGSATATKVLLVLE